MNKLLPSLKSSKDDVLKSQTYQQFMKSMDHELRRLEETEQPNNAGLSLNTPSLSKNCAKFSEFLFEKPEHTFPNFFKFSFRFHFTVRIQNLETQ